MGNTAATVDTVDYGTVQITRETPFGSGEFPDTDDRGRIQRHAPEAVLISSQRVGQNESVTTIVLGPGYAMTITEPVQLLGIDRKHSIVALQEGLAQGAVRDFDADRYSLWFVRNHIFERL